MKPYSLVHVSDDTLLNNLRTLVSRDRSTTAELLAHLGEVESRRLHVPAGYSSLFAYCVEELRMSEDMAYKRIRAARKARRFPVILAALASGRQHLMGIVLLAPYLTEATADELLVASEYKTKRQIEHLIADRFPRPDLPTSIRVLAAPRELAPEPVGMTSALQVPRSSECGDVTAPVVFGVQLAPEPVEMRSGSPEEATEAQPTARPCAPAHQACPQHVGPPARVVPLSPGRFGVTFTMPQSMHDKLQRAQELLSHQLPSGDIPAVLERALEELLVKLEKAKFAATDRPQRCSRERSEDSRHIPAEVRRAVRVRDRGQCTFVSPSGHRCGERRFLEYDHVTPYARDGRATTDNIRLRCRAHNQHEAERIYGLQFIKCKQDQRAKVHGTG